MIQKTYGITDLVDWKAQINVGKARVIVQFSGGAVTAFGVTPAEYTTSDPFFQSVIENSDYFKSGRINLLREIGHNDTPDKSEAAGEEAAEEEPDDDVTVIEASCREDVVEYLRARFGYTATQLRTKSALAQALKERGLAVSGVEL